MCLALAMLGDSFAAKSYACICTGAAILKNFWVCFIFLMDG